MKILFVNQLYHPYHEGGAEKSVQLLAETLVGRGHAVSVVTTACDGSDREATVNGVKVRYMQQPNFSNSHPRQPSGWHKRLWHLRDAYNLSALRFWRRTFANMDFDLLHTNTIGGFSCMAWKAAAESGRPVVHTLRDYYLLCPKTSMFRDGRDCVTPCSGCRALAWPKRLLSAHVSAVIGNSRKTLERHVTQGFFPTAQHGVIHNIFTAPDHVAHAPAPRSGSLILGYFGVINEKKGFKLLLEALSGMPDSFELVVGGKSEGELPPDWKRLLAKIPVRFTGWIKPEDFFGQIDCLVMPAIWQEPLPRVVIESLAMGVPVVATAVGGNPELVEHDRTGYIVAAPEPAELRLTLSRLNRQTLASMRPACLQAARRFSPAAIASAYEAVYASAKSRKA